MELRVVRGTDRFAVACRLFGELLGWPITREWDDDGRGRIFGQGDARIELMEAGDGDDVAPVTGVFVSVEHDDVVSLHEHLTAAGVEVTQALTDQPWGHRSFGIVDPSGLTVVFFQWI